MAKRNMSLTKNPMPSQEPDVRNKNFLEVALGYTEEMALDEAQRCLNCKHKPCVEGCPVHIDIPSFIHQVTLENYEGAYEIISQSSSLPAVCGRVCPQESQCEKNCVRGIKGEAVGIGRLERFVADRHNSQENAGHKRPAPSVCPSGTYRVHSAGSGLGYSIFFSDHIPSFPVRCIGR